MSANQFFSEKINQVNVNHSGKKLFTSERACSSCGTQKTSSQQSFFQGDKLASPGVRVSGQPGTPGVEFQGEPSRAAGKGSRRDLDPGHWEKIGGNEKVPIANQYLRAPLKSGTRHTPETRESSQEKNLRADVLGGHIASPWVKLFKKPTPSSHHLHKPQIGQWCHIREGVCIPMPTDKQLFLMTREFFQRAEGQPVGPVTAQWRETTFACARALRIRLFGNTGQVTGL